MDICRQELLLRYFPDMIASTYCAIRAILLSLLTASNDPVQMEAFEFTRHANIACKHVHTGRLMARQARWPLP